MVVTSTAEGACPLCGKPLAVAMLPGNRMSESDLITKEIAAHIQQVQAAEPERIKRHIRSKRFNNNPKVTDMQEWKECKR